jgi:hypothetical protein
VVRINELLTADGDPLEGLGLIEAVRREVDEAERELIEAARAQGHGWAAIAAALGLRSRQAAEQRWLRLSAVQKRDPGPERARRRAQQSVDDRAGIEIARLRQAVIAAYRQVKGPELLKQTLAAAIDAPPGALFELATKAVQDAKDSKQLRQLREALSAAMP